MTVRRMTAAFVGGAAMIAMAGCGGGDDDNGVADKSADEILDETTSAVGDTESARIDGDIVSGDASSITFDLEFDDVGGHGSLSMDGTEFEILSVDGTFYMKGSAGAWDEFAGGGLGQMVADKYVLVPENQAGPLASFADLTTFTDELLSPDGDLSVAGEMEIDDQKVIGISSDGGVLYVATTGEPLPVQMRGTDGDEGTVDFEWDVDVEIEGPADDDVLDMSELG